MLMPLRHCLKCLILATQMTLNRTNLFIAVSSIALLILLIIQVNWIVHTAKIKEDLFNEKANMVLSRTTEVLGADKETRKEIGDCMEVGAAPGTAAKLGAGQMHKIDSLFNYYMQFYNFHIDYYFEVVKPKPAIAKDKLFTNFTFNKCLEEAPGEEGIELKLIFPEKKQYIMAEMGPMFITSVILILVVLIMFWRTVMLLMKEKKISEHTSDFLNNMTHEFKTPLTNIALAGKMIIKEPMAKENDKIKHYSGIILEENEKLRLQVEQVLSMTALERGEIPLQKTELDLHALIKECVKCISIQVENKQGFLKLTLDADRFVIMGDKTHLTNALSNLIDNAIKYSAGKPEISIRTFNSGSSIIIEVADKGIGIEKEFQKKVFDKFFRVPTGDVHDVKGFGLGLAYIKKIIELHGGSIELKSNPDSYREEKGATFTITLPCA